jgi:hypothetical protein
MILVAWACITLIYVLYERSSRYLPREEEAEEAGWLAYRRMKMLCGVCQLLDPR